MYSSQTSFTVTFKSSSRDDYRSTFSYETFRTFDNQQQQHPATPHGSLSHTSAITSNNRDDYRDDRSQQQRDVSHDYTFSYETQFRTFHDQQQQQHLVTPHGSLSHTSAITSINQDDRSQQQHPHPVTPRDSSDPWEAALSNLQSPSMTPLSESNPLWRRPINRRTTASNSSLGFMEGWNSDVTPRNRSQQQQQHPHPVIPRDSSDPWEAALSNLQSPSMTPLSESNPLWRRPINRRTTASNSSLGFMEGWNSDVTPRNRSQQQQQHPHPVIPRDSSDPWEAALSNLQSPSMTPLSESNPLWRRPINRRTTVSNSSLGVRHNNRQASQRSHRRSYQNNLQEVPDQIAPEWNFSPNLIVDEIDMMERQSREYQPAQEVNYHRVLNDNNLNLRIHSEAVVANTGFSEDFTNPPYMYIPDTNQSNLLHPQDQTAQEVNYHVLNDNNLNLRIHSEDIVANTGFGEFEDFTNPPHMYIPDMNQSNLLHPQDQTALSRTFTFQDDVDTLDDELGFSESRDSSDQHVNSEAHTNLLPIRMYLDDVDELDDILGFIESRDSSDQHVNIQADTDLRPIGVYRDSRDSSEQHVNIQADTDLCPIRIYRDGVAIWVDELGFRESRDSSDQHLNIQADTDQHPIRIYRDEFGIINPDTMSYEELLDLSDRNGAVPRGLSVKTISSNLKTRQYHVASNRLNESRDINKEVEICIVCQDEYKNRQKIGTLDCGHEYHANCIKRWLRENNVCPVCKRPALTNIEDKNGINWNN